MTKPLTNKQLQEIIMNYFTSKFPGKWKSLKREKKQVLLAIIRDHHIPMPDEE